MQQLKPVFALIALLQSNFQLGDEILCPLCILRLVNIGADTRSAAEKLVCQYSLMLLGFDPATCENDLLGKIFGLFTQYAVGHSHTSKDK